MRVTPQYARGETLNRRCQLPLSNRITSQLSSLTVLVRLEVDLAGSRRPLATNPDPLVGDAEPLGLLLGQRRDELTRTMRASDSLTASRSSPSRGSWRPPNLLDRTFHGTYRRRVSQSPNDTQRPQISQKQAAKPNQR